MKDSILSCVLEVAEDSNTCDKICTIRNPNINFLMKDSVLSCTLWLQTHIQVTQYINTLVFGFKYNHPKENRLRE